MLLAAEKRRNLNAKPVTRHETRHRRTPSAIRRRPRSFCFGRRERAGQCPKAGRPGCGPIWGAPAFCVKKSFRPMPKKRRWRALPGMICRCAYDGAEWSLELPLIEPGYFKAKAYLARSAGLAALAGWPGHRHLGPSGCRSAPPTRSTAPSPGCSAKAAQLSAPGTKPQEAQFATTGCARLHRHSAFGKISRPHRATPAYH